MGPSWAGNFVSPGTLVIPSCQMFSTTTARECLTTFILTTLWHLSFHVSSRVESWDLSSYSDAASYNLTEIELELWSVWRMWRTLMTWDRACTASRAPLKNSGTGQKQTNEHIKNQNSILFLRYCWATSILLWECWACQDWYSLATLAPSPGPQVLGIIYISSDEMQVQWLNTSVYLIFYIIIQSLSIHIFL